MEPLPRSRSVEACLCGATESPAGCSKGAEDAAGDAAGEAPSGLRFGGSGWSWRLPTSISRVFRPRSVQGPVFNFYFCRGPFCMYGWTDVLSILSIYSVLVFSFVKNVGGSTLIRFFIIEDRFVRLYLSLIHSFVGRNTNFVYYKRQRIGRFLFKLKVI
jgi:hypothetical protein